ncbi:MAG: D-glycerate dehydrogenase [Chloroflexi bacterium]|nr:D-glycerate dehydrogenase [Chloroflexota bacterium]MCH2536154.1 D-glycerate dehydrogenase [Dehalococcoidia bacterium]MEE2925624.1 D-glycerate dehydrogenase [Chloroflexota bacterium]
MVNLRPRVFVTRQFFPEALEVLTGAADTEVWPDDEPPTPEQLLEKAGEADGILTNIMDRIDADVFQAAHRLKVVSQLGVGVDNIDVAEATRRGVLVGNTPGVLAKATADIAFGLLMSAARRISEGDRWLRAGNWKMQYHPMVWLGAEIHGATLGIVGMGQIGVEMAKRARGFDMRVIYYSRTRKLELESELGMEYFEPSDLLSTADFVTLHIPLTQETRHFIGERELRLMKPTAILINAARGAVVDSRALYTALKEGWISGAALDVTDPEPILPDDPLLTLDNLVITPHIGSASIDSRRRTCLLAARNVVAGIQGRRLEACANPEVYAAKGI